MPVTPFHFGPGLLLAGLTPASFAAFALANVVIDVESVYHVVAGIYPVHTFLHTVVGSTLVAIGVSAVAIGYEVGMRRQRPSRDRRSIGGLIAGAFAGAWSHVLLDGIMHADMRPLAPWSAANPLLGVMSLLWLHALCVATGAVGTWRLLRRRRRSGR